MNDESPEAKFRGKSLDITVLPAETPGKFRAVAELTGAGERWEGPDRDTEQEAVADANDLVDSLAKAGFFPTSVCLSS